MGGFVQPPLPRGAPLLPPLGLFSSLQLTGRIERINIQTQIHRIRGADSVANLLDDAVHANGVNLAGLDNLKAAIPVILIVRGPAEGRADTSVNVGVVLEQTLLGGMVEIRAVVDARNLGGRAAKDLGAPCARSDLVMLVFSLQKFCFEKILQDLLSCVDLQVSRWLSKCITDTGP